MDHAGLAELAQTLAGSAARAAALERYSKLSRKLHVLADGEIAKVASKAPPAACHPTCCFCCYGIVPVTIPDLVELLETVATWPEADRHELLKRCEEYAQSSNKFWQDKDSVVRAACPFLVDKLCTVYEHRPITCRARNSYDPHQCEELSEGKPVKLDTVPGQLEVGEAITTGLLNAFKQEGRFTGIYELGAAFNHLVNNPEAIARLTGATRAEENPVNQFRVDLVRQEAPIPLNDAGAPLLQPPLDILSRQGMAKMETFAAAMSLAGKSDLSVLFRLVFPEMYDSQGELEEWWQRYQDNLDLLCSLNLDPALAFEALGFVDTFHLAYNGKNVKPVLQKLMTHAFENYARPAHPELTRPFDHLRRAGKFRLGYASWRLKDYNGSRWALGWLKNQNPEIETFAFNLNATEDLTTAKWRRLADHYYHLPLAGTEAARLIRPLDLDALLITDIGEDGMTLQLSLLKCARKQFTAWGHTVTSGSPIMDYYLSSIDMEPPNGEEHYTETLIRLPGSGQVLAPHKPTVSDKSAAELGLPEGGFYLLAQTPSKLLPLRDQIFKEITDRTGKPLVICHAGSKDLKGERTRERMAKAGVNVRIAPWMPAPDFYRMVQLADCVLDSFDFTGGITTIDTLSLGAPLISCPGEFMRGRLSIPFMKQAGLSALIANSVEEYIELACDLERVRAAMANWNPEPMFNDLRPVRAIDELLLSEL